MQGHLLPKYQGRCPNVWAIINGEKETGITIHKIEEEVDAGDIAFVIKRNVNSTDTGSSILDWARSIYPEMLIDFLKKFESNKIELEKQNIQKKSYFGKREASDGLINWNKDVCRIYDFIRAQTKPHYPGAFTFLNNMKIIIWESKKNNNLIKNATPGKIIEYDIKNDIFNIACNEGIIEVTNFECNDIEKIKKGIQLK